MKTFKCNQCGEDIERAGAWGRPNQYRCLECQRLNSKIRLIRNKQAIKPKPYGKEK